MAKELRCLSKKVQAAQVQPEPPVHQCIVLTASVGCVVCVDVRNDGVAEGNDTPNEDIACAVEAPMHRYRPRPLGCRGHRCR